MVKVGDKAFLKPQTKQTIEDVYERELVKKRHNCTDIICLLIFIIFGLAQVGLSLLVFLKGGDPRNLFLPHDSSGNLCAGSKPNLFFFNLASCVSITALSGICPSPTICVQSCPKDNLFYMIDSQRQILFNNYCLKSKLNDYFSGSVPSSIDATTYSDLASKQICPTYTISSDTFYSRCLPTLLTSVLNGVASSLTATDSSSSQNITITDFKNQPITDQTLVKAAQYVVSLLNLNTIGKIFKFKII
jgi:hypothetical protein